MYYYGQNYGYPGTGANGYTYTPQNYGGGFGGWFCVILVIFILLVVIGCGWGGCGGGRRYEGGF